MLGFDKFKVMVYLKVIFFYDKLYMVEEVIVKKLMSMVNFVMSCKGGVLMINVLKVLFIFRMVFVSKKVVGLVDRDEEEVMVVVWS